LWAHNDFNLHYPIALVVDLTPNAGFGFSMADQIARLGPAEGTQRTEQADRFEQIRLPLTIVSEKKHARAAQLQTSQSNVTKVLQVNPTDQHDGKVAEMAASATQS